MKANLELVRHALESLLKQTAPTRGSRESIHVDRVADPLDVTQQAAERELALHSLDRESALARRLRSAIERINDGSYGVCLECEEEIAQKRLKAIPWAELCIRCQEAADLLGTKRETVRASNDLTEAA